MITRFYLEEYLSFKTIDLEFQKGLIVFTGPSGAGKSVLFSSLLSLLGFSDAKALLSEITIENIDFTSLEFAIESYDDMVFKQLTNVKSRSFLNNQTVSKKRLKEIASAFTSFLHLKDISDFHSSKIVSFLDALCEKEIKNYSSILNEFIKNYEELSEINKKLKKIDEEEKNLSDLKEYAQFEIDKIAKINPQVGEYDELKNIKSDLAKKEKLEAVISETTPFLSNTHKISHALEMLEEQSAFFDDAINEVNNIFEKFQDKINSMESLDIEETLNRIEQLSGLIKRFGSIEDALEYKALKEKELQGYENISFEKTSLEKKQKKLSELLNETAKDISAYRVSVLPKFEKKINEFLKLLYLKGLTIEFRKKELDQTGYDEIEFFLDNTPLDKISSGEFNRLRLALLTARAYFEKDSNGILFLDEIDANLSGKESQSIAKVLTQLSKNYQIFAISHQPQLSAKANQHFMVLKTDGVSTVKKLDKKQRVNEIARMISGESITQEAKEFANKLLNEDYE